MVEGSVSSGAALIENAAELGRVLRICSSWSLCASAHTAAKASAPSVDRAIANVCSMAA